MKFNKKAEIASDNVVQTIIWIGILAAAVVAVTFIINKSFGVQ